MAASWSLREARRHGVNAPSGSARNFAAGNTPWHPMDGGGESYRVMKTIVSPEEARLETRSALSKRDRFGHFPAQWNQCMPPRIKPQRFAARAPESSTDERRAWEEAVAGWWWL